jgi:hypothetical protein
LYAQSTTKDDIPVDGSMGVETENSCTAPHRLVAAIKEDEVPVVE